MDNLHNTAVDIDILVKTFIDNSFSWIFNLKKNLGSIHGATTISFSFSLFFFIFFASLTYFPNVRLFFSFFFYSLFFILLLIVLQLRFCIRLWVLNFFLFCLFSYFLRFSSCFIFLLLPSASKWILFLGSSLYEKLQIILD